MKSSVVAHEKINYQRSIGVQTSQKQIKPYFRSKATSCDLPTVCEKMSTDRGCSPIDFSKQRSIVSTSSSSIESIAKSFSSDSLYKPSSSSSSNHLLVKEERKKETNAVTCFNLD